MDRSEIAGIRDPQEGEGREPEGSSRPRRGLLRRLLLAGSGAVWRKDPAAGPGAAQRPASSCRTSGRSQTDPGRLPVMEQMAAVS